MQFVLNSFLILLVLVGFAFADGIEPSALAKDGAVTRYYARGTRWLCRLGLLLFADAFADSFAESLR